MIRLNQGSLSPNLTFCDLDGAFYEGGLTQEGEGS
jgi:hypothetical protein